MLVQAVVGYVAQANEDEGKPRTLPGDGDGSTRGDHSKALHQLALRRIVQSQGNLPLDLPRNTGTALDRWKSLTLGALSDIPSMVLNDEKPTRCTLLTDSGHPLPRPRTE